MNTILEFHDVLKKFSNGVYALNNVSFKVDDGEFVAIIGPSGSRPYSCFQTKGEKS